MVLDKEFCVVLISMGSCKLTKRSVAVSPIS